VSGASSADAAVNALRDICPFLLAGDGAWRSAEATGDHRCTAVFPPAALTTEKQRRLCLTPSHESCATFVAALAGREPAGAVISLDARPLPRTTPVVMERGRFVLPVLSMRPDRTAAQAALVILLGVAFAGLLFTRLGSGPDGSPGGIGGPSSSPAATSAAATPAPSEGAVLPSATPAEASPTPRVTLVPTVGSPAPSGVATTYTVQRGDTLSGIAAKHGTTWKVLAQLNHITNPSALRVGTVLQLP
jgi:LysM repeat protein